MRRASSITFDLCLDTAVESCFDLEDSTHVIASGNAVAHEATGDGEEKTPIAVQDRALRADEDARRLSAVFSSSRTDARRQSVLCRALERCTHVMNGTHETTTRENEGVAFS